MGSREDKRSDRGRGGEKTPHFDVLGLSSRTFCRKRPKVCLA